MINNRSSLLCLPKLLGLSILSQSPPSPGPLKSPTSPTVTDPLREKIRPRSRSMTPEKPRPPPLLQSKPKIAPPKPPRVKPRTHMGGAHLSGDQREGQTPTPPTARDDTPSSDQPLLTANKLEKAPDRHQEQPTKDNQTAVETEATVVSADQQLQQPVGEAKVSNYTMVEFCHLDLLMFRYLTFHKHLSFLYQGASWDTD